jgi:hypothetical protein
MFLCSLIHKLTYFNCKPTELTDTLQEHIGELVHNVQIIAAEYISNVLIEFVIY